MSFVQEHSAFQEKSGSFIGWGPFWLLVATIAGFVFFVEGIQALLNAWQLPEYSHGPLIPVLSALLFLRQLKTVPENYGAADWRWVGFAVLVVALLLGLLGKFATIDDIVAYALILWVGGLLLISFGWSTGKHFWPPVLHLVYMLPLPGVIYFKMSNWLQFISSELGVWFLKLLSVPVFLDGNIIDLGVTKLHVAEACSGLRYLFPILSFSYVFAVLYRGPVWHKAVLLISAAPITVVMNSVRIAVAGYIVNYWGVDWLEGFTHFFEGWVIFLLCILVLFGLARIMLLFNREKMTLVDALDLDTNGLGRQFMRLRLVQPSAALISAALIFIAAAIVWQTLPQRGDQVATRDTFAIFPRHLGDWRQQGSQQFLDSRIEEALAADDYLQIDLAKEGLAPEVSLFMAWYDDQSQNGVHSPEICLPGAGWEIAWFERTDIGKLVNSETPFNINRAIIQKGELRMMVYYWFEQKGRRIAWDFAAKYWLMMDGIRTGRTDGALVRLTTVIEPGESDAAAEARLQDVVDNLSPILPRFIPL
ncbi:transmembrane exosortase [Ruegeria sp. ANG-R]|uniref:VPLPA-CTERM-specific exosortase XrtD n=1 Tax=Ruegeria sp. ANG-R TaxID=1577903 RepID=UPI00057D76FF|nr:VPLPA-CTERM-specific exosortase XrtD [Ruegeria sp. ANG-R]KIC41608.1 transmembrane exosortase [Ruegeria sp. ANG-R]